MYNHIRHKKHKYNKQKKLNKIIKRNNKQNKLNNKINSFAKRNKDRNNKVMYFIFWTNNTKTMVYSNVDKILYDIKYYSYWSSRYYNIKYEAKYIISENKLDKIIL